MKKVIFKSILYLIFIIISLEIIVRIFHLHTEDPPRFIDKFQVEKRVSGHQGHTVTGNRKQNSTAYRINKSGYNSFREFTPSEDKYEIAIVGDSFIEGFHQDYNNSIAKKIETQIENVEVYQYGYAGYDLANQMHLINAYKDKFELIDIIVIYLNYKNDLDRDQYKPDKWRVKSLSSPMFKLRNRIKILYYSSSVGIIDPIIEFIKGSPRSKDVELDNTFERDVEHLSNFKNLVKLYGYDKQKTVLLIDSRKTSKSFLKYCDNNGFKYIDFTSEFDNSKQPTTLIYDKHWNNHGRELIAKVISNYIESQKK